MGTKVFRIGSLIGGGLILTIGMGAYASQLILNASFRLNVNSSVKSGPFLMVWATSPTLTVEPSSRGSSFRTQVFNCGKLQADGMSVLSNGEPINLVARGGGMFITPNGDVLNLESAQFYFSGLMNPPHSILGYRCQVQVVAEE